MVPRLHIREESMDEGWEVCAQALAGLHKRCFWVRSRANHTPMRFKSLDMPDPPMNKEMHARISDLVETSGIRYARLKKDIRQGEERGGFSRGEFQSQHDPESEQNPLWNT